MSTQKLTNTTATNGGVQLVKERNRNSNKVKLCGYLKKKRNKVGGWRKMWFVLQDKLLLSYTSKEEYDNKLVSFIDVLNLVPGTMVRPLGGFRFTIETTTHVMYTFHCDDRNAYREWITTLLDSLSATKLISATSSPCPSTTLSTYSLLPMQYQRFHNTSVDNIPHALWSNAAENSQRQRELSSSCELMRQRVELVDGNYDYGTYLERITNAKKTNRLKSTSRLSLAPTLSLPTHGSVCSGSRGGSSVGGGRVSGVCDGSIGGAARLPIARSTAKILERNGVNSSGLTKKHQQQQQQYEKRQQQQQLNCCNRSSGTIMNANTNKKKDNHCYNNECNDNVADAHFATNVSTTHFRLHGESTTNPTELNANVYNHNTSSTSTRIGGNGSNRSCSSSGNGSDGSSAYSSSPSATIFHKPINQSVLRINSMFQQLPTTTTSSSSDGASASRHQMINNKEFLLYPKSTQTNCDQSEFISKYNHNNNNVNITNSNNNDSTLLVDFCSMSDDAPVVDNNISGAYDACCINESEPMVIVKDQIQRMNIKGRKEVISYENAGTVDRREQKRIVVTKRLEKESITETVDRPKVVVGTMIAKSKSLDCDDISKNVGEEGADEDGLVLTTINNRCSEPIYAVVDLAHKYAQRQQRIDKNHLKSLDANRCRSYESIIQGVEPSIIVIESGGKSIEKSTIYANEDDIDGIYEDGDNFVTNCENNSVVNGEDDENIYEPVGFQNFPNPTIDCAEQLQQQQPNTFWRYITRLKVNSLLQITRMRRNQHVDYDALHLPNTTLSPSPTLKTNNKKPKTTMTTTRKQSSTFLMGDTPTAAVTQFANIKHKFGAHRKSMQVRVRKICSKRTNEPNITYNNNYNSCSSTLYSNKKQSCNNGDKQLFGATTNGANNNEGGENVDSVIKKSKYRWKSVKIRPKQFNSAYNSSNCSSASTSTTDDICNTKTTPTKIPTTNSTNATTATKRQRFFGSLPHLRKTRVSLFSTPNLHLTTTKDQNSNLSQIVAGKMREVETEIVTNVGKSKNLMK